MFRFKDLANNRKNTAKMIQILAPMHLIAQHTMPSVLQAKDEAILAEINKYRTARAKNKSEEEKKKLETYRDRLMIKKLKGLDMAIKDIDFDVYIEVQKVGTNVTGNQNFYELSN